MFGSSDGKEVLTDMQQCFKIIHFSWITDTYTMSIFAYARYKDVVRVGYYTS